MNKQSWEREFRRRFTKKVRVEAVRRKPVTYYRVRSSQKALEEMIEFIHNLLNS